MFPDCRRVYWSPQLLNPKNFKVFPICRLGIRRLNSWGPGKGSISQKTSKPKFDGKMDFIFTFSANQEFPTNETANPVGILPRMF